MRLSQERIGEILDNIKNEKSYYSGGSLCVDDILPDGDVLILNLSEEFLGFTSGIKGLLNIENTKKLFAIYKDHKGETSYYKENLEESHIKNLI